MKRYLKVTLIIFLLFVLTLNPVTIYAQNIHETDFTKIDSDNIVEFNIFSKSNSINLNLVYSVSLNPGYIVSATFTPSASGLYYFETLRNPTASQVDTVMQILGSNNTVVASDDNSGENSYSAIGIRLTAGAPVTLRISLKNTSTTSSFYFQVRRQKASIFTYDYGDGVNTIPDANAAKIYSDRMGYLANSYINNVAPFNMDQSNIYNKLNSEILFFSGHGSPGSVYLKDSPNSSNLYRLDSNQLGSLKNTKVALWATCYSASSGSQTSVAQTSYRKGASVSIGWTDLTYVRSSKVFTDKFFEILSQGYSVNESMAAALTQFTLPYENLQKYAIFGDSSIKIASPAIKPKSIFRVSDELKNEFDDFLENSEYYVETLTNDIDRYYKVFDGFLSSDFYDVFKDSSGNILNVRKSQDSILDSDAENLLSNTSTMLSPFTFTAPKTEINTEAKLVNKCNYLTVLNEILTPVHIEYYVITNQEYGYEYMEVICTNMSDGSSIDYLDINTTPYI